MAKKGGWNTKTDPMLKFYRKRKEQVLLVYQSEACVKTVNPKWKPFVLQLGNVMDQIFVEY